MSSPVAAATDRILAAAAEGIGWLTFNNPDKRNAISLDMWRGVAGALDAFAADDGVRVVVMRGAGGKAFVSGADISQFEDQRGNAEQAAAYEAIADRGKAALDGFAKPLIAMIEGFCIGGGVRVALSADLRIAADTAIFAIPASRLGLGYSYESLKRLVDLIGPAAAKDLLFTARRIGAAEALTMGLINRVVPAATLDAEARRLAAGIAANAPLTARSAKFGVDQTVLPESARDLAAHARMLAACFNSADYAEGRAAFREKRKPTFTGR